MQWKFHQEVTIPLKNAQVKGELIIPKDARSVILFSHGSGSSRLSPRNQMVANYFHHKELGTLLFDLLTEEEDRNYQNRFNIRLLTERLVQATEWVMEQKEAKDFNIGYFGASTGAASALNAASLLPNIGAVVSRGGRPDLAGSTSLRELGSPTLFIVGSRDTEVLELNRKAYSMMNCERSLQIIPGASHLFEEKGAMEKVCGLATEWFKKYLHLETIKKTFYVP